MNHGDYATARDHFKSSLALSRALQEPSGITNTLGGLGYTLWILGEYSAARQLHEEMLALAQENGDQGGLARAIGDLAIDHCGLKQFKEAEKLFQESLARYLEICNPWGIADELGDLGEVNNALGNHTIAAEYAAQSLASPAKHLRRQQSWELRVYGNAMCSLGKYGEARRYFRQSLELAWANIRPGHVLITIVGIADLLQRQGKQEYAVELLSFAIQHPASWQWGKDLAGPILVGLHARLPADTFAAAQARGRSLALETTVAELLDELVEEKM